MSEKTEIIALKYGESMLSEDLVIKGGRKEVQVPIAFIIYLVRKGKRLILIDAGCDDMPGFETKYFCGSVAALKAYGIDPETITDLVITHADHDHIGAAERFSNAVIYMQKEEYLRGRAYIPKDRKLILFEEDYQLSEDMEIIRIGGHGKGSCIIRLHDGGKIYVFAGDECYVQRCLDSRIPTGNYTCLENSERFIEEYSNSKYSCLLCHEPSIITEPNGWKRINENAGDQETQKVSMKKE